MARQLTLAALEELRKNPIVIPELPAYEAAETIVDPSIAPRVHRRHQPETERVSDEVFERWLALDLSQAPAAAPQIAPPQNLLQRFFDLFSWLRI